MTRRRTVRDLRSWATAWAASWATLALLMCGVASARAQLHITPEASNEAKPIIVEADETVSWTENNLQILLLRGNVRVEQGLLRLRTNEAVVWLSAGEPEQGRALPVVVYSEGEVAVDRAGDKSVEPRVVVELKTKSDLKLQTQKRSTENRGADPFYRRALAERQAVVQPRTPAAVAVQATRGLPEPPRPRVATVEVIPAQFSGEPPPAPQAGGPLDGLSMGPPRRVSISPRGASDFQFEFKPISDQEQAFIISGGLQVFVDDLAAGSVDISADRAVLWFQGKDAQGFMSGLRRGQTTQERIEVYLEGHVEIRQADARPPDQPDKPRTGRPGPVAQGAPVAQLQASRLLLADQVYYDVSRNVALLLNGEVIVRQPGVAEPVHLRASEIRQLGRKQFEASNAEFFASRLPSDPDVKVFVREATLEEREVTRRGLFGLGEQSETQLWATGDDVELKVRDFPIAYLPFVEGDLRDPLGPLDRVRVRTDRIFGFGLLLDWDVYELFGAARPAGTRWRVGTDYLSKRGPALETEFETSGDGLLGVPGPYASLVRGYVIHDDGTDVLGGPRTFEPPRELRGRFLVRHRQEISDQLTFLGQAAYISDQNFLEQYFKREWEEDINQETFAYLKYQQDNWALSVLVEPGFRPWLTQTNWLPRADGYWIGQDFFERLTYFARANAGYAQFEPTHTVPQSFVATPIPNEFARVRPLPPSSDIPHTEPLELGRFDLYQELDFPFEAGPFKLVPYGLLEVTKYTETLADADGDTRVYGGGGLRASIPFTRLYPDACSTLFNVRGIAHKVVFDADYRYVRSNLGFRELPELDRLNDDATDQAQRDMRNFRLQNPFVNNNLLLATSPLYDPQLYLIRKGIQTNVDTLDDLQFLRLGVQQRWQTKRGFPGHDHIIDWMTLNLSGTFFPESDRDNFGHAFAFLEYDYTWHLGDRTTLLSSGWIDPYEDGARVFNVGLLLERPERIRLYLGYREIDPVGSNALIASTSYLFSPKWAASIVTSYDFGENQSLGNSLILTRIGSDVQVSLGIGYDALTDNFGVTFEIVPTLAPGLATRGLPVTQ